MEVYNLELRFSENIIQNGSISLSFLAACRIKADFHLKTFIRNSKIGLFSIVVFRANLKKVEVL